MTVIHIVDVTRPGAALRCDCVWVTDADPNPPRPILRAAAIRDGYSDKEIQRFRRRGAWSALRRGAYLPTPERSVDRYTWHRRLVDATAAGLHRQCLISHVSAAVVHGIPLWSTHLGIVHITREPPASTARSSSLLSHVAAIPPEDVMLLDELAVTAPARTVVDLARSLPFEQAVVAADGALHRGLTTPADLAATLDRMAGVPGVRAARRVAAFADARAESVGESRSRVMIMNGGLPPPDLQLEIRDLDGVIIGRGDFGWCRGRVVGEFDGRAKYGRLRLPGESAGDAVFREKRREDALRSTGCLVVRWVWDDLAVPIGAVARIRRAIALAGQRR